MGSNRKKYKKSRAMSQKTAATASAETQSQSALVQPLLPEPAISPGVQSEDLDHLNLAVIPVQQEGIWSDGSGAGFLYEDFGGMVWKVEPGGLFHIRDAARATGKNGYHWHNSPPPKDFDFNRAGQQDHFKKSRFITSVQGLPPVSVPGGPISIIMPENAVFLDGSGSYHPQGEFLKYEWSLKTAADANAVTIDSPTSPKTVATFASPGIYIFNLKVSDRLGMSSTQTLTITVLDSIAPSVVRAGDTNPLKLVLPANAAMLDGSSLVKPGAGTSFIWEQLSGPTTPVIVFADKPIAQVAGLVAGRYEFQLAVFDKNKVPVHLRSAVIEVDDSITVPKAEAPKEAPASSEPAPLRDKLSAQPAMYSMPMIPNDTSDLAPYPQVKPVLKRPPGFKPRINQDHTVPILAGIALVSCLAYLYYRRRR